MVCRSGAEQDPYFVGRSWCVVQPLRTGDYSVIGHHEPGTPEEPRGLAIERKGPGDLFSSLSRDRERLEREMERTRSLERCALVAELDYRDMLDPERGSHPRQLLAGVYERLQAAGHADHSTIREVLQELGWWTRDELWRSQASPAAIEGTLLTWADRYRIEVHLAGSHRLGERWTYRRLATWWRRRHPEAKL